MFALVNRVFSGVEPLPFWTVLWDDSLNVLCLVLKKCCCHVGAIVFSHEHKASFHESIIPVTGPPGSLWWL